jgi:cyclase
MEQNGAGELLLTSMDMDGTKKGYDLAFTKMVSEEVEIPIIASGGVGEINHLIEGVTIGGADAVLAASIFHFDIISIEQVKRAFRECGINVRDSN